MLCASEGEFADSHEGIDHLICHPCPRRLVPSDDRLEGLDQKRLCLAGKHLVSGADWPRPVLVLESLEDRVVVAEEPHPLVGDVDVEVSAFLLLVLDRHLPAAERVLVDLGLDLVGSVGDVNGGAGVGGAHLRLGACQRREKLAVDQGGFLPAEPRRHVTCHPEVRVLVDGTGNEAEGLCVGAENVRERHREGRGRLYCRERVLPDVV
mmetsp:Transcript_25468/g.60434  ORF Transcript_25468/g.60434 Transcript_25468/m.60434 type:complete len:208 (+) Transcript_25468:281-904(+)